LKFRESGELSEGLAVLAACAPCQEMPVANHVWLFAGGRT